MAYDYQISYNRGIYDEVCIYSSHALNLKVPLLLKFSFLKRIPLQKFQSLEQYNLSCLQKFCFTENPLFCLVVHVTRSVRSVGLAQVKAVRALQKQTSFGQGFSINYRLIDAIRGAFPSAITVLVPLAIFLGKSSYAVSFSP